MGLAGTFFNILFGDRRNLIVETAEAFRPNAEASAQRASTFQAAALAQFSAEFAVARKGGFDRFMDGINRVPRPAMALGTLLLLGSAMTNPEWFAARMQGIALVPEPLWWLMGAIVSFYFGARHQAKGQDFQKSVAQTLAAGTVLVGAKEPEQAPKQVPEFSRAEPTDKPRQVNVTATDNAALDDWRAGR